MRCCGVHRAVRCEPVPLLIRHHRLLGAPAVCAVGAFVPESEVKQALLNCRHIGAGCAASSTEDCGSHEAGTHGWRWVHVLRDSEWSSHWRAQVETADVGNGMCRVLSEHIEAPRRDRHDHLSGQSLASPTDIHRRRIALLDRWVVRPCRRDTDVASFEGVVDREVQRNCRDVRATDGGIARDANFEVPSGEQSLCATKRVQRSRTAIEETSGGSQRHEEAIGRGGGRGAGE